MTKDTTTHSPSQTDVEWGRSVLPTVPSYSDNNTEEEESNIEVAICGGGLAGLAAAIGLHRANIPCRVYERAPQLRSVSQGVLSVDPHGMQALEALHPDLPGLIEEAGNELLTADAIAITPNEDGSLKEESRKRDIGSSCREKFGRVRVLMTWAGLQQILASLLPPETIVTGRSLVSFEESENDILLHLAEEVDNLESSSTRTKHHRVRAKCVLACDGVFSAARRQLFQDNDDAPIYFGQLNWGTVISTDMLPESVRPLPNTLHIFNYNGDRGRWMSMLIDGGHNQTFWQLRVADPAMAKSLSQTKGRGGLGLPGVHASLLPLVAQTKVATLLQATPEGQIFERSIVGRLPSSTWCSGRLALVGDAAHGMHPACGQGANSAFGSVQVLVQQMKEEWDRRQDDKGVVHWQSALAKYEELRKPKADIVQRWSNLMGCNQASGENKEGGGIRLPNREINAKIEEWTMMGEANNFPDPNTLELLQNFDPCSLPGVSKIR